MTRVHQYHRVLVQFFFGGKADGEGGAVGAQGGFDEDAIGQLRRRQVCIRSGGVHAAKISIAACFAGPAFRAVRLLGFCGARDLRRFRWGALRAGGEGQGKKQKDEK